MLKQEINVNKILLEEAILELQRKHKHSIDNHYLNLDSLNDFIVQNSIKLNSNSIKEIKEEINKLKIKIKKEQQADYSLFENKIKNDILNFNEKIIYEIQDLYNSKLTRSLNNICTKEKSILKIEKNNIFNLVLSIPTNNKKVSFNFSFSYDKESKDIFNILEKKMIYDYDNYRFHKIYDTEKNLNNIFNSTVNTEKFNIIVDNLLLIAEMKKTNHHESLKILKEYLSENVISNNSLKTLLSEIKDNALLCNDITIKAPKQKKKLT